MNIVIITGRLTRDPEKRQTSTGSTVMSFTLAVDRNGKNKETDFIRCEAWGKTADFIAQWFTKGSPIEINGALRVDTYEKDGQKRELTKIVVNNAGFVLKSNSTSEGGGRNSGAITGDTGATDAAESLW